MANIVVRSDKFATARDFVEAEDFIYKMMESAALVPHHSIDAAIADYWSPQSAVDELWLTEHYEEFEDCDDSWYQYQRRQYEEYVLENEVYDMPMVWEYDLAAFVTANDIAGLCNFLRRKGVLVFQSV